MIRIVMIAAATAAVLALSPTAFARKPDHGTADEAKAMLAKAVAALKADKQKTLDLFFDRDLYVFCANVSDGKSVALGNGNCLAWTPGPLRTPPARHVARNSTTRIRSRKVKSLRSPTCL
jgi:hypothetical protein